MLIDSHCHLDRIDLAPFENDFSHFMDCASRDGIEHMVCISIGLDAFPSMCNLVNEYKNISTTVGVHPNQETEHEPSEQDLIKLAQDPKIIGIGETGLDYFRSKVSCLASRVWTMIGLFVFNATRMWVLNRSCCQVRSPLLRK